MSAGQRAFSDASSVDYARQRIGRDLSPEAQNVSEIIQRDIPDSAPDDLRKALTREKWNAYNRILGEREQGGMISNVKEVARRGDESMRLGMLYAKAADIRNEAQTPEEQAEAEQSLQLISDMMEAYQKDYQSDALDPRETNSKLDDILYGAARNALPMFKTAARELWKDVLLEASLSAVGALIPEPTTTAFGVVGAGAAAGRAANIIRRVVQANKAMRAGKDGYKLLKTARTVGHTVNAMNAAYETFGRAREAEFHRENPDMDWDLKYKYGKMAGRLEGAIEGVLSPLQLAGGAVKMIPGTKQALSKIISDVTKRAIAQNILKAGTAFTTELTEESAQAVSGQYMQNLARQEQLEREIAAGVIEDMDKALADPKFAMLDGAEMAQLAWQTAKDSFWEVLGTTMLFGGPANVISAAQDVSAAKEIKGEDATEQERTTAQAQAEGSITKERDILTSAVQERKARAELAEALVNSGMSEEDALAESDSTPKEELRSRISTITQETQAKAKAEEKAASDAEFAAEQEDFRQRAPEIIANKKEDKDTYDELVSSLGKEEVKQIEAELKERQKTIKGLEREEDIFSRYDQSKRAKEKAFEREQERAKVAEGKDRIKADAAIEEREEAVRQEVLRDLEEEREAITTYEAEQEARIQSEKSREDNKQLVVAGLDTKKPTGITSIQRQLGVSRTETKRILDELIEAGEIERREDGKYYNIDERKPLNQALVNVVQNRQRQQSIKLPPSRYLEQEQRRAAEAMRRITEGARLQLPEKTDSTIRQERMDAMWRTTVSKEQEGKILAEMQRVTGERRDAQEALDFEKQINASLYYNGRITQKKLADDLSITKAEAKEILTRMEKSGQVFRTSKGGAYMRVLSEQQRKQEQTPEFLRKAWNVKNKADYKLLASDYYTLSKVAAKVLGDEKMRSIPNNQESLTKELAPYFGIKLEEPTSKAKQKQITADQSAVLANEVSEGEYRGQLPLRGIHRGVPSTTGTSRRRKSRGQIIGMLKKRIKGWDKLNRKSKSALVNGVMEDMGLVEANGKKKTQSRTLALKDSGVWQAQGKPYRLSDTDVRIRGKNLETGEEKVFTIGERVDGLDSWMELDRVQKKGQQWQPVRESLESDHLMRPSQVKHYDEWIASGRDGLTRDSVIEALRELENNTGDETIMYASRYLANALERNPKMSIEDVVESKGKKMKVPKRPIYIQHTSRINDWKDALAKATRELFGGDVRLDVGSRESSNGLNLSNIYGTQSVDELSQFFSDSYFEDIKKDLLSEADLAELNKTEETEDFDTEVELGVEEQEKDETDDDLEEPIEEEEPEGKLPEQTTEDVDRSDRLASAIREVESEIKLSKEEIMRVQAAGKGKIEPGLYEVYRILKERGDDALVKKIDDLANAEYRTAFQVARRLSVAEKRVLQKRLEKMLGHGVSLSFMERMFEQGAERLGKYRAAMIEVVEGTAAMDTLHHEAVHAAEDMFLTEREKAALERMMPDAEERAEGFIDYVNSGKAPTKVATLWRKLLRAMKRLFAEFQGRNFKGERFRGEDVRNIDEFYQALLGGEFAERGQERGGSADTKYSSREEWAGVKDKRYPIDDLSDSVKSIIGGDDVSIWAQYGDDRDAVVIARLAVPEDSRNIGLGRKAIEKIKDFARKYDIDITVAPRSDLVAFYERMGFEKESLGGSYTWSSLAEGARYRTATKKMGYDKSFDALQEKLGKGNVRRAWHEAGRPGKFRDWVIEQANNKSNPVVEARLKAIQAEDVKNAAKSGDMSSLTTVRNVSSRLRTNIRKLFYGALQPNHRAELAGKEFSKYELDKRTEMSGHYDRIMSKYSKVNNTKIKRGEKISVEGVTGEDGKRANVDMKAGEALLVAMQIQAGYGRIAEEGTSRPVQKLLAEAGVYIPKAERRFYIKSKEQADAVLRSIFRNNPDIQAETERLNGIFDDMYEELNEVFNRMTGKNLKKREFYAHVVRDHYMERKVFRKNGEISAYEQQKVGLMALMHQLDPENISEIKTITGSGDAPIMLMDIYDLSARTVNDAAKFISMAEYVRDTQELINDGRFRDFILHRMGNNDKLANTWLQSFERDVKSLGGTAEDLDVTTRGITKVMRKGLSNSAVAFLSDPFTSAKQLASIGNLATQFDSGVFAASFSQNISTEEMKRFMESGYGVIEHRGENFAGGLSTAMAENPTGWWAEAQHKSLWATRNVDRFTVRRAIAMAKTQVDRTWTGPKTDEYYATVGKMADRAVIASQVQTTDINRSNLQRHRGVFASGLTFMRGARAVSFSALAGSAERIMMAHDHLREVVRSGGDLEDANRQVSDAWKNMYSQVVWHGLFQSALLTGIAMGKWKFFEGIAAAVFGKKDNDDDDEKRNMLLQYMGGMTDNMIGLAPYGSLGTTMFKGLWMKTPEKRYFARKRLPSELHPIGGLLNNALTHAVDTDKYFRYKKELETGINSRTGKRLSQTQKNQRADWFERVDSRLWAGIISDMSQWAGIPYARTVTQGARTLSREKGKRQ